MDIIADVTVAKEAGVFVLSVQKEEQDVSRINFPAPLPSVKEMSTVSHIPALEVMDIKGDVSQRKRVLPNMVGTSVVTRENLVDCAACQKPIRERYLLKALDQFWHEDCLKCACCDCRLGEVGSTLFTKANLILCKRDYLRLFGTTGLCSACNKTIPAFEMVMRARGNVYHLECFACQQCNHRFCVGDRFYLFDNKVLCEYDYEERVLFASLPYSAYNSLDQIQRQTDSLTPLSPPVDDASSGYGSPSSLISDGH